MYKLIDVINKYLASDKEAMTWILSYIAYAHSIDDIIDQKDKWDDKEFILKTFEFSAIIYSSPFYIKNIHILFPLVKAASNSYADSLVLEKSDEKWKRNFADVLRQQANEVTVAVIEIVAGYDKRREASLELRELSYYQHHTLDGIPC